MGAGARLGDAGVQLCVLHGIHELLPVFRIGMLWIGGALARREAWNIGRRGFGAAGLAGASVGIFVADGGWGVTAAFAAPARLGGVDSSRCGHWYWTGGAPGAFAAP